MQAGKLPMDIKAYRARTMYEALQLVRQELGPDAAVLRTREVGTGVLGWLRGGRRIEVLASGKISVPSRLRRPTQDANIKPVRLSVTKPDDAPASRPNTADMEAGLDLELVGRKEVSRKNSQKQKGAVTQIRPPENSLDLPETFVRVYADLIEAEFQEHVARELLESLYSSAPRSELANYGQLRLRLARMIEANIEVAGEINTEAPARRVVALVGPTGVGKTTTIAKLAANLRLRQHKQVGLVTVDTYRIAAVEQLRTYAEIMDLPMEVVSTPRDMRRALARMNALDVVLMDTAGRSPHDEIRLQELRTMLGEAQADDVHLVLSSAASAESLTKTATHFAGVGTTALILTKLDESTGLGNVLPLLRSSALPLSYVTDGQNVPDDIAAADASALARRMLTISTVASATCLSVVHA
jgi:flagellar biosynthesis protein FlhF